MQGDLNATKPKVDDALDAFEKAHPDARVIDEYRKRLREAGNEFSGKVLGAANNERAKKVYYEEYIYILGGIFQDVNEAERLYSQESFFSAQSQQQKDESIELTDLTRRV